VAQHSGSDHHRDAAAHYELAARHRLPSVTNAIAYLAPYVRRYGLVHGVPFGLRVRALRRLPKWTLVAVDVPGLPHPVQLRTGTADKDAFQQVFVDGEHDIVIARPPTTILDVGAQIGLASVRFATRWPNAHILAVEPERSNFELLCQNVAPYPHISPVWGGLWPRKGWLSLVNPDKSTWGWRAVEDDNHTATSLPAVTAPELLAALPGGRADLVKIDIEGSEVAVFRDGPTLWLESVETLMIELHDRFQPGCRAALDTALAGRGFIETRSGEYIVLHRDSPGDAGSPSP
jgi:FkbM family methyltransferase